MDFPYVSTAFKDFKNLVFRRPFWFFSLCLLLLGVTALAATDKEGYLENNWLIWDDLVDPSWNAEEIFRDLKINEMADNDPRAEEVIRIFLERWNQAPINPAMDGKKIKIPGFVVPLDFEDAEIKEFFLVPFFGACIHVPPPPPNQIIYVYSEKSLKGLEAMEVVWVYGRIKAERFETDLGNAGYSLPADKVEFYREDS
ncbi:MAG: DUF3299 domain-containing protein [Deltaproteobacteria bacterium]|jgi:hypothetical protein|nr:DUF3299 domain-containing protein [Deltaproteobacteria bacterium]